MPVISRGRASRESRRVGQFAKFRLAQLNLIPLVDTFVALVFFTLLTQTTAIVPVATGVQLPEAREGAEAVGRLTLGIGSSPPQVTFNDRQIMTVQQAARSASNRPDQPLLIPELYSVLSQAADSVRRLRNLPQGQAVPEQLAIHGDRTMRYDLLSRIMQTARLAGFTNITLQVRRTGEEGVAVQQQAD